MTHKEQIARLLEDNPSLKRFEAPCEILIDFDYLFAIDKKREGHYLVWVAGGTGTLTEAVYDEILAEAKVAGLKPPHHIYARYQLYQTPNIRFQQIF